MKLRIGVPTILGMKGIGSEMCSSNSPALNSGRRKDKMVKITADFSELSEKSIAKEDAVGSVGTEEIRSNLGKLNSMTVKELRTLTRSVGISTSGTKQELISSLKSFPFKGKTTASDGTGIPQGLHDVLDSAEIKRRTRRKKMVVSSVDDNDSESFMEHNELPIVTEEISGTVQSQLEKHGSSGIQSLEKDSNQISLPASTNEPWAVLAHKKPQREWIPYNPRTMRPPPLNESTNSMKLISWNVNGLRALLKLKSFSALQLTQQEDFDVLCLQETKLQEKDVSTIKNNLIDGYDNSFWTCSASKLGYSGTAIISRRKPISVNYGLGILDHDTEGRIVTVEFEKFYLISGYVPNSGDGLRRLAYRVEQWDPSLSNYMKELEKVKPVVLTGDLNCAHEEIDIYNPADGGLITF
ncbi:Apurinic endonuclease-redox protein [Platanthera guangdongensis]|uniref:DNA-(apurinic or apyrimidinic site) endonuclease n=1 Tax=Platanthera guangdongensis TaxID=2320717 RepID=A0ABR2LTS2_9ASPA